MLNLAIADLLDVPENVVKERITDAGGAIRLRINVKNLYQATSRTDLALNWLKVWYTAECLAEHAESATCTAQEGDQGSGDLIFDVVADDPLRLAESLIEFAAVYDEDDLETFSLVFDAAEEWLLNRGGAPSWFPVLEQNFRVDAAAAAEFEGLRLRMDS